MPETWKGKTRGGTFGYMFFIYMIRCLGITAAYGFLSLVVLYFIPFRTESYRQYLAIRTEQTEIRTCQSRRTVIEKLLPAGADID